MNVLRGILGSLLILTVIVYTCCVRAQPRFSKSIFKLGSLKEKQSGRNIKQM